MEAKMNEELSIMKEKEGILQDHFKKVTRIEGADLHSMFFAFLNRQRLVYSLSDIFEYVLRCFCLRDSSDHRNVPSIKKHFLFDKAEERFCKELDVVRIIRTLRRFKLLS